jgi:hypothetical protein
MNAVETELMVPPDEIGEPKTRPLTKAAVRITCSDGPGRQVSPSDIPPRQKYPTRSSDIPPRKHPVSPSDIPPRSK